MVIVEEDHLLKPSYFHRRKDRLQRRFLSSWGGAGAEPRPPTSYPCTIWGDCPAPQTPHGLVLASLHVPGNSGPGGRMKLLRTFYPRGGRVPSLSLAGAFCNPAGAKHVHPLTAPGPPASLCGAHSCSLFWGYVAAEGRNEMPFPWCVEVRISCSLLQSCCFRILCLSIV